MKKILVLVILSGMFLNIFAMEPASLNIKKLNVKSSPLKTYRKNIKKVNVKSSSLKTHKKNIKKVTMKENASAPIQVSISQFSIGTSQDGRWYYGFYLYNESKNNTIRKDQLNIGVWGDHTLKQMSLGVGRHIYPQKKILVRNYFKFYHNMKNLVITVFKKGSYEDFIAQKKISLPGDSFKEHINFKNVRLINDSTNNRGTKIEYCVVNDSPYNFSVKLSTSILKVLKVKTTVNTTFLLKRKNAKCGIIDLGMAPAIGDIVIGNVYDMNGNSPYTSSESSKKHDKRLSFFEF